MKIILAPNAFKESLTAHEAASAMVRGFRRALPGAELIELPVADGGDGTAEVLRRAIGGEVRFVSVTGPLGGRIKAPIIRLKRQVVPTDVIEMAKCSGLALIPREKRTPMLTTTYGLGEMIAASLKRGARRIIITLGGSATVDGGAGMAQALGFSLLDRKGRSIPRGGRGLELIGRIEPPSDVHRFSGVEIIAVCDVKNKLLGSNGAAAVFGPQKGATPEMIVTCVPRQRRG
ncbi:glycerate kinase [Candidatus Sumerlaeota bacterium]|nr:glycerate kinase [Candidatus Sumerlaeota bacterium]